MSEHDAGMLDNLVTEIEDRVDKAADVAKALGGSAEASVGDVTSAVEHVVSGGAELAGDTFEDAVAFAQARIKEGLDILRKLKDVATG